MKKLLLFLTVICLALLVACDNGSHGGGGIPTEPSDWDGTVYSPNVDVSIVTSSNPTTADGAAYNAISSALHALRGKVPARYTDVTEQTSTEIAIGNTNRPASVAAYNYIAKNAEDTEDGVAYCIYYKDGVLAVAATNDYSMTLAVEYMLAVYLQAETLTLNNDHYYAITKTAEEYENMIWDELITAEKEKFDNRWDDLSKIATADTVAAFKRLYNFYGTDVIYWFANLWEPSFCFCGECDPDSGETTCYGGGFYYANSARDYEGFYPDLESTRQTLVFLRNSGMLSYYEDDLDRAIPEWMQEKILAFIAACADPDGYYYHPQWGKTIGTSRKGRDLDWAIDLTNIFGGSFKYPTALDQMADATSYTAERALTAPLGTSTVKAVSAVLPAATAADCLDSPENMIAWLNTMNFKADSHNNGHAVGSLANQIKAKGYGELVYNYFVDLMEEVQEELRDEAEAAARKENPSITPKEVERVRMEAENGLWQKEINYVSLSGLYKIGGMINILGYDLPHQYAMAAVRSGVKAITLEEEPTILVHVFNNWAGLNTQLSNMRSANKRAVDDGKAPVHDMEAAYDIVRAEAPALIDATIAKLSLFRKSDGSFSYYQKISAPTTQGVPVSLGFEEGDVNASMISLTSISNFMFSTMGYTRVPMYHLGHFKEFLDIVEDMSTADKIKLDTEVNYDFENTDGSLPVGIQSTVNNGELSVIADPTGKGMGDVLSLTSFASVADTFQVNVPSTVGGMSSFAIEADYCVYKTNNVDSVDDYQFTVKATNGNVYMYTLAYNSGDSVTVGDDSSTGAGNVNRFGSVKKGEWFKLRIECYKLSDGSVKFKVILNGETVGVSENFFGSENAGATPKFGLSCLLVRALMRTDATLLIDNLVIESYNNVEFTEN